MRLQQICVTQWIAVRGVPLSNSRPAHSAEQALMHLSAHCTIRHSSPSSTGDLQTKLNDYIRLCLRDFFATTTLLAHQRFVYTLSVKQVPVVVSFLVVRQVWERRSEEVHGDPKRCGFVTDFTQSETGGRNAQATYRQQYGLYTLQGVPALAFLTSCCYGQLSCSCQASHRDGRRLATVSTWSLDHGNAAISQGKAALCKTC